MFSDVALESIIGKVFYIRKPKGPILNNGPIHIVDDEPWAVTNPWLILDR